MYYLKHLAFIFLAAAPGDSDAQCGNCYMIKYTVFSGKKTLVQKSVLILTNTVST